ncbi:MAG: NAD(P)-dependent oxidoreductase [Alphaproteobacteria bacterium]|nr:NAD(P)-dependent oxidoreductase [Alphaproteobacteria bacterium]NCQ88983.1 NAD(P)-dependent oxidoreductase [Alphaproteobacteria bacterium]NCT07884.1 NAD(P)-dependent oxidoreductase [Alphaproteobacteria bacterium]
MKIAVTGGSGFIGGRLIKRLQMQGHEIINIDIASIAPIDIEHKEPLIQACAGCDAIYHLAALHRDDIFPRSRYYDVNSDGTKNVIEAAKANGIKRIIFTSTFALYGLNTGMPDEMSQPKPFNDYGASKLEAEVALKTWAQSNSSNIATIIRPVVVFGEGNRGNVYTLLNQITKKQFFMIGDGTNKKSMAYVENVAAFLEYCLNEKSNFEIYNYADKPDFNMKDLITLIYTHLGWEKPKISIPYAFGLYAGYGFDAIARLTKKQLPISAVRVQKFCANTTCEAEKYRKVGFVPEFTLGEGVRRQIDHDFAEFIAKSGDSKISKSA